MKIARWLIVLICIVSSSAATAGELSYRVLNNDLRVVDPSANFNVVLEFTNLNESVKKVHLKLNSKEGFKFISDYSSITISGNSTIRKIIGIHVPNGCKSGTSTLILQANENTNLDSLGEYRIDVSVNAKFALEIEKIKEPPFLFSGDTTTLVYVVRNLSNSDVALESKITEGVTEKKNKSKLSQDSSTYVYLPISIEKYPTGFAQRSIFVSVQIENMPQTQKSLHFGIDVFSVNKVKFDAYNRFPIRVTGVGALTTSYGKPMYSGIYDVSGRGYLGKPSKNQLLEFHMRGPNQNGNPLFGLNDEYNLKYSTPKFKLSLGDNNYGLSELTESSRSGLGVGTEYQIKKFSIGSYYVSPKYFPLVKHVISLYTKYQLNEHNKMQLGYLLKVDTMSNNTNLFTISSENRIAQLINTNVEYSFGFDKIQKGNAYKGDVGLSTKLFSTNLSYTYADSKFPGYIQNTQRIFTSASLNLQPISFSVSYNRNSSNIALDTLFSKQPISTSWGINSGLRISSHHSLNMGGMISSTKENSDNPLYDYKKYNARVGYQSQYDHFNLLLQCDLGKMRNNLKYNGVELMDFLTSSINMHFTISNALSASTFGSYQLGQQGITGSDKFYYGCAVVTNIREKLSLSLQYNSNFEWKYYTSDRNLFSMDLYANINPNNQLGISANYNLKKNSLDAKELYTQLRFTHTINVPVSKKMDIGTLSGRILNNGVNKVSGIRLNINGILAITDKDGNFKFPAIPVGKYILGIDVSSFGLHSIAVTPGPYMIEIKPATETKFELAMTKAVRIEGKLMVQEDANINAKGYIPVYDQLDRLVIEASCGSDIFRVLTNKEGFFSFEDLRPGTWSVKIYPNGLPRGYQLQTPNFNINLAPGQEEKIEVKIQKKARQIQFQNKF